MTTTSTKPIKQIEKLHERLERARQIVADGLVHPALNQENHYVVASSGNNGFYIVNGECVCMDAQQRTELHHGYCKHKLAVELYKEQQEATTTELSPKDKEKLGQDLKDLF